MMNSLLDLNIQGLNNSVKDINHLTTNTNDMFIMMNGFVGFDGISTIVSYLMPNLTYIYMICKHILSITFLNKLELFFCTQLNVFNYCYITVTI